MEETKQSYRECSKNASCKGLKKGVKGYRSCLDDGGCMSEKRKKQLKPKAPPVPARPTKERLEKAMKTIKTTDKNPWLKHIAMYRIKHPELSYKDAMKNARASYTPIKK
jgi:hypothetical protein